MVARNVPKTNKSICRLHFSLLSQIKIYLLSKNSSERLLTDTYEDMNEADGGNETLIEAEVKDAES